MNKTLVTTGLRLRGARYCIARQDGRMRVLFGAPSPGFISASSDVFANAALDDVWVARLGHSRARLIFSTTVPERIRQRIRNVWTPPPGPRKSGTRGAG